MIHPNPHSPSPPRDRYDEADHDRALSRLAQDINDTPRPWDHEAEPVVRDGRGGPVDLGDPWTRKATLENLAFVAFIAAAVVILVWAWK